MLHSHEVAAKQSAKASVHDRVPLMSASGVMGAADAPQFFESINFVELPVPLPQVAHSAQDRSPPPLRSPSPRRTCQGMGKDIAKK